MNSNILIIGLVWPEPTSSAAGWHMLQLISQLKMISQDIHFACAASKSESSFSLETIGVKEHQIVLNNTSFNDFVGTLNPGIVVYDRFIMEEQFGWRVKQTCPRAITVLDTEDLHFVRKARASAFKTNMQLNLDTSDCYRELSSIYRCDLSIIISKYEYDLLLNYFKIPERQLLYLPFIESELTTENFKAKPKFNQRKHLMFIGNFIHEPNYQTVIRLKKIWPFLKKRLSKIEVHVYGAYVSQKILQLHNEKEGFYIKGKAENVNDVMKNYRVLVAPIPFGAGLKGKFVDGFKNGLPCVTSKVGSEGMDQNLWGGIITVSDDDFVDAVCELYENETVWTECVEKGRQLVNLQFSNKIWDGVLKHAILSIGNDIENHKNSLFIQKIMWQNNLQATKYMSLWIEEKNKSDLLS